MLKFRKVVGLFSFQFEMKLVFYRAQIVNINQKVPLCLLIYIHFLRLFTVFFLRVSILWHDCNTWRN